jgi:hypothetical protein
MGTPITAASATSGMANRQILNLDRGNPLAAGLDDVLGTVGDLHVAELIDMGDVTGVEPALRVELLGAAALVIGGGDGRAAHLEPAEGLAVPGQGSRCRRRR